MQTIAEQAHEVNAAAAGRLPAAVLEVFGADRAALTAAGIPAGAIAVGDEVAPFALADATGQTRTLVELTADGPAILVFYRGGWCPYCNLTLRAYESDLLPRLAPFSAQLVAISPELPDASLNTQEKAGLTYTVLSDPGAEVAAGLGIVFDASEAGLEAQRTLGLDIRATRSDHGTTLAMPTVVIVDRDHVARFVDIHPDYVGRTEVEDILAALEAFRA